MRRIQTMLVAVALMPFISHADVSFIDDFPPRVTISKEIKVGDYDKINATIGSLKATSLLAAVVMLNSRGGDVVESIKIGRKLREIGVLTTVREGDVCISSCVLILAAGMSRGVFGKVGIHRPYLGADKATTEEEQKANYARIEKSIKEYLASVNINTSLYDTMFRIPPEKVRFLTERELQDFGLNEPDPYWMEASDTRAAAHYGLNKREWVAVKASCLKNGPNPRFEECKERVLKGMK